jgi:hypothetical protein
MTDPRQLPLEPTEHINPRTIVELMPGTDAVCMCGYGLPNAFQLECLWPFCGWKDHLPDQEDE